MNRKNMNTISDFEDMLTLLEKHGVKYLITGGLAFIFHVKPRFTKDIDIWIASDRKNIEQTNLALTEFGSPRLLDAKDKDQILQIGVAPNRVDILTNIDGLSFESVWHKRIRSLYGKITANWIDLDSLLDIKSGIDDPRHKSDARYLKKVKEMSKQKKRKM